MVRHRDTWYAGVFELLNLVAVVHEQDSIRPAGHPLLTARIKSVSAYIILVGWGERDLALLKVRDNLVMHDCLAYFGRQVVVHSGYVLLIGVS